MNRPKLSLKKKVVTGVAHGVTKDVTAKKDDIAPAPLSPKKVEKATLRDKSKKAFTWLHTTFPNTFKQSPDLVSPLKIGIHKDLKDYLTNNASTDNAPPFGYRKVREAVLYYVTRAAIFHR